MGSPEVFAFGNQHAISSPGVSWSGVIGGAFVIAALSLILLALGAGFGLAVISPWSNTGRSVGTVETIGLIWVIVTQVIASALGGYLAGRLRTRWESLHNDEVHFRDTANGFLAWAIALVVTTAFLASAAARLAGNAEPAGDAPAATNAVGRGDRLTANGYFVDRLFRSDHPSAAENDPVVRAEAGRAMDNALRNNQDSAADTAYLAQLVAAKTGLTANDAQQRVSQTMADARQSLDRARSVTARVLLWTFLALLIGAFCASFAATIGGKQRDHVQAI